VVSKRALAFVSSLCLLLGALLVGSALHGGVVTNQYAITSPAAVFRLGFGVVLIGIGYRFRVPPDERASLSRGVEQSRADTNENGTFDPEDSPLDEVSMERLAERERDDDR
jgi:hypothetical protein